MSRPSKYNWGTVIPAAVDIVKSYDTPVTLRQLFYRLVSLELLPNTRNAYTLLSSRTAELRRRGEFPDLLDNVRDIHAPLSFSGPDDALQFLLQIFRRDRTEGQHWTICLGVEKAGLVQQLTAWFGDRGIPVLSLGGFSSQTYVKRVLQYVEGQGRPAVLLYAGDYDASGLEIERDFVQRTPAFMEVRRVALTLEQIAQYDLPLLAGKKSDSRAARFAEVHGGLFQVELDALEPPVLHALLEDAVSDYWHEAAYAAVMERERSEYKTLMEVLA